MPLNWTEAQSFCREVYTDLATIETTNDTIAVVHTTPSYTGKAWIGLYNYTWRWSLNDSSLYGEGEAAFTNWFPGHPYNPNGQQNCVVFVNYYFYYRNRNTGNWFVDYCSNDRPFLCHIGTVNGTSSYVKIDTPLNWTEAQRFCRQNYADLASIRNQAENDLVTNLTIGENVWIGLHWEQLWSDGSTSLFQNWASGSPVSTEQCVTTEFSNSRQWSDANCSLTLPFICYTTTPPKTEDFRSIGQDETSITLQWNKVNNSFSFILQFNGAEINIPAANGDGPVTHTVSSLTAATKYTFTLFSVFENVRSSGVNVTAVTAPPDADNFRATAQEETSITLQWNKVNSSFSFILQVNGAEIDIPAPDGHGPVTYTVSSLTAETTYTFTLFSVFEDVRSSGVTITAVTKPYYVLAMNINLEASTLLSDSDLLSLLEEVFRRFSLSPQLSFKVLRRAIRTR
ncbi:macrophage mannose receptor 1-like [Micropterus dolomieu]|uniref:macrophage mannose receptor 1-like n=1 Tax=Micropterus dolomieu TaxID=147949 RepID=UPI001E8D0826|nr:macrophage mannose receptor 1-like [Micropterus dolomieu]